MLKIGWCASGDHEIDENHEMGQVIFLLVLVLVLSEAVIDSGACARGFYHEGHRGHEEGGNKSWWESEG